MEYNYAQPRFRNYFDVGLLGCRNWNRISIRGVRARPDITFAR